MPGLLRGVVRTAAIAGTATAVSNRVSRRQGERWASQQQAAMPPAAAPSEPMPTAGEPAPDRLSALKTLGELKSQGVLTEEEFNAEKAKILGSEP
ncbi:SHOCT domain-containing protein [Nocardia sp. NPDC050710]|uniref:SHOCT domain-containing protein n=1 Tax=Nocardia sp. NPDC050710 TaxID=3157220 RepID=UPI0033E2A302